MSVSLADLLPDASWDPSSDVLLDRFLEYTAGRRLTLYPAQEEAILELLDGKNVVLNTPTGSGKSLVAFAMLFASLARGSGPSTRARSRRSSTRSGWGCAASSARTRWASRPATRPSTATRPSFAAPPRSSPTSRCAKAPTPPSATS